MKQNVFRWCIAWFIHLFTACGAVFGMYALYLIYLHNFIGAFWLMVVTILIDAVDGFLARLVKVKEVLPNMDGALLDNTVDFFTYAILPAYFLLVIARIVPHGWHTVCAVVIVLASCYQFCQKDAKTDDHFFKRFPSYWNIVVFYLFFWDMNPWVNVAVIFVLGLLSFIPLKYVYPSRLDYLAKNPLLRQAMGVATIIWGVATIGLLWVYPKVNVIFIVLSMGYVVIYLLISFYRTWKPVQR